MPPARPPSPLIPFWGDEEEKEKADGGGGGAAQKDLVQVSISSTCVRPEGRAAAGAGAGAASPCQSHISPLHSLVSDSACSWPSIIPYQDNGRPDREGDLHTPQGADDDLPAWVLYHRCEISETSCRPGVQMCVDCIGACVACVCCKGRVARADAASVCSGSTLTPVPAPRRRKGGGEG